jgi:hypothetical protein
VDLRVQLAVFAVVLNPLRSEREAFRFLIYVVLVVAVLLGIVFGLRAIL